MNWMRRLRVPVLAVVVVAVAATVALAGPPTTSPPSAPPGQAGDDLRQSDEPLSGGAQVGEEVVEQAEGEEDVGVAPDHSACEGLTGLENAACRVRANHEAHPNRGLENALSRLEVNMARVGAGPQGPPDNVEPRGLEVAAAHGASVGNG